MIGNAVNLKRFLLCPEVVGFLVAIVSIVAFLGPRILAQRSYEESFKHITLKMSKQQMEDILHADAVRYDFRMRPGGTTAVYEYSDYLRSYWIMVDGKTNQVRRKGFYFLTLRWSNFR